jgi:hypothetical protein
MRWFRAALLCVCTSSVALAQAPEASSDAQATNGDDLSRAREEYRKGVSAVQNAQWAEALAAFERSYAIRPHPLTLYNIAACERALGRYAKALASLRASLAAGSPELAATPENVLPPAVVDETTRYISELVHILAHLELTLEPRDATLTIDGRPLDAAIEEGQPVFVAGRRPPGLGEKLPQTHADVILDPGAHVLTVSRHGYADRVINEMFAPGSHQKLVVRLEKLPGILRISSDRTGTSVRVNSRDVGSAPVEVTRRAGRYRISLEKPGYVTYETSVSLRAGEQADIRASLKPVGAELQKKWWFWTAAGVVLVGATIGTYYATRPEPQQVRPPLEGGGLGWNVKVQ